MIIRSVHGGCQAIYLEPMQVGLLGLDYALLLLLLSLRMKPVDQYSKPVANAGIRT